MPPKKKLRLENHPTLHGFGFSGMSRQPVRTVDPLPVGVNFEYAKWTRQGYSETIPPPPRQTSFHTFLVGQGTLRGFRNHQNTTNNLLCKWIQTFDAAKEADDANPAHQRKPIDVLIDTACDTASRLVEQESEEPVEIDGEPMRFCALDERIRDIVEKQEADQERVAIEESAPPLQHRQTGPWDRSRYETPCPYTTLMEHEVSAYVRGLPVRQWEPEREFGTDEELALIPAGTSDAVRRTIQETPWLEPRSDGIWCRCCSGPDASVGVFSSKPLTWSDAPGRLTTKAREHLSTKTRRHQGRWDKFLEQRRNLAHYGEQPVIRAKMHEAAVHQAQTSQILNAQELIKLLHYLSFVAKHNLAHTQYPLRLRQLSAIFEPTSRQFLSKSFNLSSDYVARDLINSMSSYLRTSTLSRIRQSPFVAIMFDEAQDGQKRSQYGVYFRILENASVCEVFWEMSELNDSGTADNITRHIVALTDELAVWNRLVGVSSDGCSTMSGKERGVVTQLTALKSQFALWDWCFAHRLNLALIDATVPPSSQPENRVMVVAHEIVRESHVLFYHGRGNNAGKLRLYRTAVEAVSTVVNFGFWRELALCAVGDTRWVSHEQAAVVLVRVLKGLLQAMKILAQTAESSDLDQEEGTSASSARKLLVKCSAASNLVGVFLMAALGPILGAFASSLQSSELCYHDILSVKGYYLSEVRRLKDHPEQFEVYWQCAACINDAAHESAFDWQDIEQSFVCVFHDTAGVPYLSRVEEQLEKRLKDGPVLEGFSAYDVRSPCFSNRALAAQKLKAITDHFGTPKTCKVNGLVVRTPPMLDANAVTSLNEELNPALDALGALAESFRIQKFSDTSKAFLESSELCIRFPYTRRLLQIALVLPLSNASVERLFSRLKLVHTRLRGKLDPKNMVALIRIAISGQYDDIDGLPPELLKQYFADYITQERRNTFATFKEYSDAKEAICYWRSKPFTIPRREVGST